MKVAVLMGGRSSERVISLRTGRGIAKALRTLGHAATSIDAADGAVLPAGDEENGARTAEAVRALPASAALGVATAPAVRDADVVFIALHGPGGEDGSIQGLLEYAGKTYTGSGVLGSALALDKAKSKAMFDRVGVPTPRWTVVHALDPEPRIDAAALGGWPLVVKPNLEGSTVGLTIVRDAEGLPAALRLAARFGDEILIEEFIPGRELTVAVLELEAFPVVEIVPKGGFYDFEHKYTKGMSEYFCPADLPPGVEETARELSLRAALALGCRGVSRVDFRLSPSGECQCLEVNTIPGMTPLSLVPMAARARGMSYEQLVGRMLELAVEAHRPRTADTTASA
jgi:D-alanine-D-alanine ligase